jgi:two-component system, NarL family, sensor histidine kinase UhpB
MNLKLYLLLRMALVAMLCWLCLSLYLVGRSGQQLAQTMASDADQMQELLEIALQRQHTISERGPRMPQLRDLAARFSGPFCLRYEALNGEVTEDGCDPARGDDAMPHWLASLLTRVGQPPTVMQRDIRLWKSQRFGTLTIAPDRPRLLARYWNTLRDLLWLATVTVLALGTLSFLVIDRALRPTRKLVAALDRLAADEDRPACAAGPELPLFRPREFGQIAAGINRLAARMAHLSAARTELMARLITLQEQERRELAHDLHDEFGQCVAALSAIGATLRDAVAHGEAALEDDFDRLDQTVERMQAGLRGLLLRMSPPLLESRALSSALNDLVTGWQAGQHGAPPVSVHIDADADALLSDEQALCVYRLVQECLSNIARHGRGSTAAQVDIRRAGATLQIGVSNASAQSAAGTRPPRAGGGMGLRLLAERLHAHHGRFAIEATAGRFAVLASLPLDKAAR